MRIQKIFENNKLWVEEQLKVDKSFFDKLSANQNPGFLYIGCSDSRVTAEELMGVHPGEVFVYRNIANMVSGDDLSVLSVLNYAVCHLEVEHIVVCGHYNCGGIKAAMQHADLGILNPWLRNIRDVYRLHRKELDEIENTEKRYDRLVELNIQEQCINVMKTPEVQRAYNNKKLRVHGWVFDIRTGCLVDLKLDFDKIMNEIMEIYRIS